MLFNCSKDKKYINNLKISKEKEKKKVDDKKKGKKEC